MLTDTNWLLLSGNNLESLNKVPDYLENITLLDLSSNNIRNINEKVIEVITKGVKHLDIRGNNLKELPETMRMANNTSELWISDNPYECNCELLWMKDWLINAKNVMDKDNVTCSGSNGKGEINDKMFSIIFVYEQVK